VEQDAVAGARSCSKTDLWKHGDVVALIRHARRLCSRTILAARPQPGNRARRWIDKDARTTDDVRLLGRGKRDLDDVDAEEGGIRVVFWIFRRATAQLVPGSDGTRAGAVDIDVFLVIGARDERVRVRSAARLHGRDLLRLVNVGDVEDADGAGAAGADGRFDARRSAIDAAAGLFDRHHQQVAPDRHVT